MRLGIFILILVISFFGCSIKKENIKNKTISEEELIFDVLVALELEKISSKEAMKAYKKLYLKTREDIFLYRFITYSFFINPKEALEFKKELKKKKAFFILGSIYAKLKMYKKAEKYLLKAKNKKAITLLADLYLKTKQYKKLEKLIIERFSDALYLYGIALLKKYKLISKTDGLRFLEKFLKKTKSIKSRFIYSTTINTIFSLCFECKSSFKIFKKYIPKELLASLLVEKDRKKALELYKEIFKEKKDLNILGMIAILEYEANKNNLKDVLKKFEKVVKKVKNSVYFNYYGYLLIDHNVNIKEGIKWVKKALKINPNSKYYLDSLAWGYFKEGRCKEAYFIMERIFNNYKVSEDEILKHFKAIRKCYESFRKNYSKSKREIKRKRRAN